MKLSKEEQKQIIGGATISGTLISALVKGVNALLDAGRYFGSSIRRIIGKKSCSMY